MTTFLAFIPGSWEWIIILAIVLLLFGHRIPSMARNLGSGIVEFKRGLKGGSDDDGSRAGKLGDRTPGSGTTGSTKGGSTEDIG
ncbi:MAG: twin-arginine translocase TatA/TatE family subunit [Planctomycetes bacterium]|nr:twin-arginine translocase TatA/TatE family subunit [Planctomycetota bacterium]